MFLGLDLGTTNVKAVVASEVGKILGEGSNAVRLFHVGQGGVEQDIEEIWRAAVLAIRQAIKGIRVSGIRAVGISSQGGALQILDRGGKPKGRVISWLDQRGRPFDRALTAELGKDWFVERVGHRGAGLAVGQLMRRGKAPRGGTRPTGGLSDMRFGFVGDLIVGRLCGRGAQDGTSAALTLLYNPEIRDYDPYLLARLGIEARQLPDLNSPREGAGELFGETARATGLPKGILVSAAIHDQYAAALSTGAIRAGTTMIGAGTAWVLLAVSDKRKAPVTENAFVCHHVAENWGQIVSLVNGGSSLTWALELMGFGKSTSREIEQLLKSAPPGSEGVNFCPFMVRAGGEGVAPDTKGRFFGLQLSHTPAHLVRAVVEGLAFELKRHLSFLERGGVPVKNLVMGGGTAASRVTTQVLADVAGLPLACFAEGAGSAFGAAILARGLVETDRSLAELSDEMTPRARLVRPGKDKTLYAERFEEYVEKLRS